MASAPTPSPSDWITQLLATVDSTVVAIVVAGGGVSATTIAIVRVVMKPIFMRLEAVELKQKAADEAIRELAAKDDMDEIKKGFGAPARLGAQKGTGRKVNGGGRPSRSPSPCWPCVWEPARPVIPVP